jgi:hypothetical protein
VPSTACLAIVTSWSPLGVTGPAALPQPADQHRFDHRPNSHASQGWWIIARGMQGHSKKAAEAGC